MWQLLTAAYCVADTTGMLDCDCERLQVEEERSKSRLSEATYKDSSLNWLKERDDLRQQISDARAKVDQSAALLDTKEQKFNDLVN